MDAAATTELVVPVLPSLWYHRPCCPPHTTPATSTEHLGSRFVALPPGNLCVEWSQAAQCRHAAFPKTAANFSSGANAVNMLQDVRCVETNFALTGGVVLAQVRS